MDQLSTAADGAGLLHAPIRIGGCLIRNRLYRAPVLEGAGNGPEAAAVYADAFGANARAGVGLIIQGNSCVRTEGRSSPGMTLLDSRANAMALAPMTAEVHAAGAKIFVQIGHAGLYAMEGWHAAHVARRRDGLLAVSRPPVHVRPALVGVPWRVLTTGDVHELAEDFGRAAAWAREASYDGVQIASANAKLIHQFLSPYYNRRSDEFGGTTAKRARILEVIADRVRAHAGEDYPIIAKIPVGEEAPRGWPRIGFDEGLELCRLAESFGYHAITPVGLSVFPHASLCRGADPSSILDVASIRDRFSEALGGSRLKMAVLRWGYRSGARHHPFQPVWNRPVFTAARRTVSIPVFAVGGIRRLDEIRAILADGQADMVGVGRPFYAEPDLPRRLLAGDAAEALCESSNRCVPPQQLGLKARCYNPEVARKRRALQTSPAPEHG